MFFVTLLLLLGSALTATLDSPYDFFFPGTYFHFDNLECTNENPCKMYLQLKNPTADDDDSSEVTCEEITYPMGYNGPLMQFELYGQVITGDPKTFALLYLDRLPDAKQEGVYPDSVFRVEHYQDTFMMNLKSVDCMTGFTFYKSQSYIPLDHSEEEIVLNVQSEGTYSPSLNIQNYMPRSQLNTQFNVSNSEDKLFIKTDFSGVKSCDHFAIYDDDRNGQVLAVPTVFNVAMDKDTPKMKAISYARTPIMFHTEFASNSDFAYNAYPPVVQYSHDEELIPDSDSDFIFVDMNWDIKSSDNTEAKVKDGREHYSRGTKLDINAELRINNSLIDYVKGLGNMSDITGEDGSVFLIFALCHVRREDDVWAFASKDTCDNSSYATPPPYECTISGKYNVSDKTMTYERTKSTRHVGSDSDFFDLQKIVPTNNNKGDWFKEYDFKISNFDTIESNPIPFRLVPLVSVFDKVDDDDSDVLHYRFIPLGPASKIYELDLDTLPALYFFLVIFIVVVVLCVLAYFVGGVIVKKIKSKKNVEAKRLTDVDENSNVSMVDTSSTSNESDLKKKEPTENDKLIEDRQVSSSSPEGSEEGKAVA